MSILPDLSDLLIEQVNVTNEVTVTVLPLLRARVLHVTPGADVQHEQQSKGASRLLAA